VHQLDKTPHLQLEKNHLHHTREKQHQSSNSLNLKPSLSPNPSRELQRNLNKEEKYHNSNPVTHIELNAKENLNHWRQDKNKYYNPKPNLNPEHNLSDNLQDRNPSYKPNLNPEHNLLDNLQDRNPSHKPKPQSERNSNPNPNLNPLDG
jgi:hypothetical protein